LDGTERTAGARLVFHDERLTVLLLQFRRYGAGDHVR
jgi:hypothetical protein